MVSFTRLDELKERRPLIHCVSNLVSANDCANAALAVGASPIMARESLELEDITSASAATVLNTGTPDEAKFAACRVCARAASALRHPLILDPVGVGASPWRLRRVEELLHLGTPSILRVNPGEARALLRRGMAEQGVDSPGPEPRQARLELAAALAERLGGAVLLSGEEDLICGGGRAYAVTGGSAEMARVTGTGCMLSVLCGAFAAVEEDPFAAAVLASSFWKTCAELAQARSAGPGSFHVALLDAAGSLTSGTCAARARIEPL